MRFLFVNGVNLNMTGTRERDIYGDESLDDMDAWIAAALPDDECVFFQSNIEGEICTALQDADGKYDGVILNAGAYSHYSIAIRDAIAAVTVPVVEVHLSNIFSREEFRRGSVLSDVCRGFICGFGKTGYVLAAEALKG